MNRMIFNRRLDQGRSLEFTRPLCDDLAGRDVRVTTEPGGCHSASTIATANVTSRIRNPALPLRYRNSRTINLVV